MGRGSKIKHIEKNNFSKFKQVLVKKEKKEDKEKAKNQRPGTSKTPETPKESERPQTSECVGKPVEHEIPQKTDVPEKSETAEILQVKNQELPETSEKLETRNGHEPNRPQKSESTDTTIDHEKSKKPDKHEKPQRAEGLQVQNLKKSDISKQFESPKRRGRKTEKPNISQKSEITHKPDEHGKFKVPDKLDTPQWPKGPQNKSQERSETSKGQKETPKEPDRPQKSECPDIRDNLEWPKKSDGIDKPKYPEKTQVKNQEMFKIPHDIPQWPKGSQIKSQEKSETSNGHKGKTKSLKGPQISEIAHNIPNEHKTPWKPNTLDKDQRPVGSKVNNKEGPGTSKRSETPNDQKGEAGRYERPQKSDSLNIPDKQESSKKPDRFVEPQKPEVSQKAKNLNLSERAEKPERQEKSESSVKLEVQKSVQIDKVPEKAIKHPLEYTWGMWLITNDKRNWEDNLVKLTSFSTVEDYWCLYHYMKPPTELERGKDYAVFKNEFRPMWEDNANKHGGRWLINFEKKRNEISELDSIWMFVVLLVIGENFRFPDAICGAVVSVRAKSRIAVWVSNYKNQDAVIDVGHTLRNTLGLRGRLSFQKHDTNTSILTL